MNRTGVLLVVMILCGIAGAILLARDNHRPSQLDFDATRWRSSDAYERGRMASSLAHGRILKGRSRAEVIELLGFPDEEKPGGEMRYEFYLSGSASLNWKEWLRISFDASGIVVEVEMID